MVSPMRIKRRSSGAAGAPEALANAELAFNEVDDTLYYGKGSGGEGGTATTAEAIGGRGAFVARNGDQSISGKKTFTGSVEVLAPIADNNPATRKFVTDSLANLGAGDMRKSDYDKNNNGKVDVAEKADVADQVPWNGVQSKPTAFPPSAHNHDDLYPHKDVVQAALDAKAPLLSPALVGNPTAPTQVEGNATTRIATTAFVTQAIANLIDGSPGILDTLKEIADALGNDPNFAATMTVELTNRLEKDENLADLVDVAIARINLGLGSLALQAANSVAITGGSIDGITLDGGTF